MHKHIHRCLQISEYVQAYTHTTKTQHSPTHVQQTNVLRRVTHHTRPERAYDQRHEEPNQRDG